MSFISRQKSTFIPARVASPTDVDGRGIHPTVRCIPMLFGLTHHARSLSNSKLFSLQCRLADLCQLLWCKMAIQ